MGRTKDRHKSGYVTAEVLWLTVQELLHEQIPSVESLLAAFGYPLATSSTTSTIIRYSDLIQRLEVSKRTTHEATFVNAEPYSVKYACQNK